ncbi:hypothetical protein [Wukongibacter sp. M2B1]|uniref:hypothetical protein n=1 Tax=Wukongibacter sp. M2B1 TaxID=3088895 RepID=UPI003D7BF6B8
MIKEDISDRQSIFLISLFLFGDATIFIMGIMAKQDFWLSIIIVAWDACTPNFTVFFQVETYLILLKFDLESMLEQ